MKKRSLKGVKILTKKNKHWDKKAEDGIELKRIRSIYCPIFGQRITIK